MTTLLARSTGSVSVRLDLTRQRRPSTRDAVVGISGARRNAAAALAVDGELRAFCEEERLTRVRATGLRPGELPREAVDCVLDVGRRSPEQVAAFVVGEESISLPSGLPQQRLDHHYAHAAAAYFTSPFERAAVLVCDRSSTPAVSVWSASGQTLDNEHWPLQGRGFAALVTECTEVFGFVRGQEHRLEALAMLEANAEAERLDGLIAYEDRTLRVDPRWKTTIADWLSESGPAPSVRHAARVASAFHHALGRALVDLAADIKRATGASDLCLGGGLFFNTFFNTLVARSGVFDRVFVAPNPGNAGLAAGAALAISRRESGAQAPIQSTSPYLGPEYTLEEIKATLDNCKLSYECLPYGDVIAASVGALEAGRLVGWFHGRMEWGHRALGNRSILANPLSPYVQDNLNTFLKHRERHRAYGLSVSEESRERYFDGPARSTWMEYQYQVRDRDLFKHVLPHGTSTLRVQTVDGANPLFAQLHRAFEAATGTGVLVNTSFNGFSEPIVCSPRDAVRAFYGSGLDLLVLDRFVVCK